MWLRITAASAVALGFVAVGPPAVALAAGTCSVATTWTSTSTGVDGTVFQLTYSDPSPPPHPAASWTFTGAALRTNLTGSVLSVVTSRDADAGEPVAGDTVSVGCSDGTALVTPLLVIVDPGQQAANVDINSLGRGDVNAASAATEVEFVLVLVGGVLAGLMAAALLVAAIARR